MIRVAAGENLAIKQKDVPILVCISHSSLSPSPSLFLTPLLLLLLSRAGPLNPVSMLKIHTVTSYPPYLFLLFLFLVSFYSRHSLFLQIGVLSTYEEPDTSSGNVRVDSGITEGSEISMFYDPMSKHSLSSTLPVPVTPP